MRIGGSLSTSFPERTPTLHHMNTNDPIAHGQHTTSHNPENERFDASGGNRTGNDTEPSRFVADLSAFIIGLYLAICGSDRSLVEIEIAPQISNWPCACRSGVLAVDPVSQPPSASHVHTRAPIPRTRLLAGIQPDYEQSTRRSESSTDALDDCEAVRPIPDATGATSRSVASRHVAPGVETRDWPR